MHTGPTSHRFTSQRLKLHYVDWGNPDAPPVVLVHGGNDHCRSWDWTAEALKSNWRVIALDLRGHGESDWSQDGEYSIRSNVYDLAQLIHQLDLAPVRLVAHSYGAAVAVRYAGIYPELVEKLVSIEGLGPSPKMLEERAKITAGEKMRTWIESKRAIAGRVPRRYESLEQAFARMKERNSGLSSEQVEHLVRHGIDQNEDGTYSWKFDNYFRVMTPFDIPDKDVVSLWSEITCPSLLLYGDESWASNPAEDGRLEHFKDAEVKVYEKAGHWLHHDQFERFIADLNAFL